jgi:hypothetical protein
MPFHLRQEVREMKFNKATLAVAVGATFGSAISLESTAMAAQVATGVYDLVILTTPVGTFATGSGGTTTQYIFGKDGAWNSSFTLGGGSPGLANGSQAMTDVSGDTWAGNVGIVVDGSGAVTVTDFQKDDVHTTSQVGTFSQFMGTNPTTSMTGSFGAGAQSLTMTGRLGSSSGLPGFGTPAWNIDDADCVLTSPGTKSCTNNGSTVWVPAITDASATNATTINGAVMTTIGDINGDSVTDYSGILVHSGQFGSAWGALFGADYHEVWNVRLLSQPVPVPAAVWLFSSGLLGLLGVARRRRSGP